MKEYYVYIMTNKYNSVLYTGVTNNLVRRVMEHQSGEGSKFTSRYKANKLVFFEQAINIDVAIEREKQIKSGSGQKKIQLVESQNPHWKDLFEDLVT